MYIFLTKMSSLCVKSFMKYKKPYNFDIFSNTQPICASPPPKFWGNPKSYYTTLSIHLIMQNLVLLTCVFQKLWKTTLWGGVGSKRQFKISNFNNFRYRSPICMEFVCLNSMRQSHSVGYQSGRG